MMTDLQMEDPRTRVTATRPSPVTREDSRVRANPRGCRMRTTVPMEERKGVVTCSRAVVTPRD